MPEEKKIVLDKKTLRQSWWNWTCWGQICYNFERMMGLGFCHSMIPILKKLGVGCAIIPFIPFNIGTSFEEGLQACRSSEALLRENGMILGYHNHAHEFNGGTDI